MENAKEQREIILTENMDKILKDTEYVLGVAYPFPNDHDLYDAFYKFKLFVIKDKIDYNLLIMHNEKDYTGQILFIKLKGGVEFGDGIVSYINIDEQ